MHNDKDSEEFNAWYSTRNLGGNYSIHVRSYDDKFKWYAIGADQGWRAARDHYAPKIHPLYRIDEDGSKHLIECEGCAAKMTENEVIRIIAEIDDGREDGYLIGEFISQSIITHLKAAGMRFQEGS